MSTISSQPAAASAPPRAVCRLVAGAGELAAHLAVRRRIFVVEQRLFAGSDGDERDADPLTLHAVGLLGGEIAGAVRLYQLDDSGVWKGDRLAVLPKARVHALGALLVRFAVATAGARGGHTMVAQIQPPNVRFFERLGWRPDGAPALYHGVTHQPMAIPLERRPGR